VTFFSQALEAAEVLDVEVRQRCELMIRLGTTQRLAGIAAHRESLIEAAHLAQDLGDSALLAQAALANNRGIISVLTAFDEDRLAVLRAALEAVGEEDSAVRARLMGTLATELGFGNARSELGSGKAELAEEAVEIARRLGDERVLLEVSRARLYAAPRPERTPELVAEIPALLELAERVGDAHETFWVCALGYMIYTEMADMEQARILLQQAAEIARETNNRTLLWFIAGFECAMTIMSGSGDHIEEAALKAFELGNDSEQPDALAVFAAQLFYAREAQGRLGELVELIRQQVAEMSSSPAFQAALALALVRDGKLADARSVITELLTRPTDPFPHDLAWLVVHTAFGMAIASAGSAQQAGREYEYLTPCAGRLSMAGSTIGYPVNLALAVLAARAGWPARAEEHFADARAQAERLGALSWQVRTELEWGRSLLQQGETQRARDLLVGARRRAEQMSAGGIVAEVDALLSP
jgi:tetratricopeptide (TPR) repeat protein